MRFVTFVRVAVHMIVLISCQANVRSMLVLTLMFLAPPVFAQEASKAALENKEASVTAMQVNQTAQNEFRPYLLESLPPHVLEKLEKRPIPERNRENSRYIYDRDKLWPSGYTIKVAFKGGSPMVHAMITRVADEWTNYGNIAFDFGYDPKTRQYRTWSDTDTEYSADVRIAFDQPGYWSAIGTESQTPSQFKPNERSMNLNIRGFDPSQFYTAVLHEFGHVLGFKHEHQRPEHCEDEMRFEDDAGYVPTRDGDGCYVADSLGRRPGIYTWCAGTPNRWTRSRVNWNVKALSFSSAFELGPADMKSIMRYHFPSFFYKSGLKSPCYTTATEGLSEVDKQGMSKAYPFKF